MYVYIYIYIYIIYMRMPPLRLLPLSTGTQRGGVSSLFFASWNELLAIALACVPLLAGSVK